MSRGRRGTPWQRDPTPDAASRQPPAAEREIIHRTQDLLRASIPQADAASNPLNEILALCTAAGILHLRNGSSTSHAVLASARNALPYIDAMWEYLTMPKEEECPKEETPQSDPL